MRRRERLRLLRRCRPRDPAKAPDFFELDEAQIGALSEEERSELAKGMGSYFAYFPDPSVAEASFETLRAILADRIDWTHGKVARSYTFKPPAPATGRPPLISSRQRAAKLAESAELVCLDLIDVINARGGVKKQLGELILVTDPSWGDLAEVYLAAQRVAEAVRVRDQT